VTIEDMRIVSEASPTRKLVTARITEGIVQGRFKPGDRLIERELCELLGVSRTSLREAFRELERDGLIENIPNKGPIVARLSSGKVQGVYEVRAALESLAVRLFTQRASEDEIASLEAALDELGVAFSDFSPDRFFSAARNFYGTLLRGARNETLEAALGSIYTRVSQLRLLALRKPGYSEATIRELGRIVRHIKARNADAASAETLTHVGNAAEAVLAVLNATGNDHAAAAARTPALAAPDEAADRVVRTEPARRGRRKAS
jgi:DNA-binding GntR family transcriptional regulator